jgi:hypothetical protein
MQAIENQIGKDMKMYYSSLLIREKKDQNVLLIDSATFYTILQFLIEICCSSLIKHDAPSEKN